MGSAHIYVNRAWSRETIKDAPGLYMAYGHIWGTVKVAAVKVVAGDFASVMRYAHYTYGDSAVYMAVGHIYTYEGLGS